MKSDLDLLKEDKHYYGETGKQYLSNSDIGTLLRNPKHFGEHRADNKNFAYGRYFHQSILEPAKAKETLVAPCKSRNTKIYKEFIAENDVPVAILESEKDEVDALVAELKKNREICDLVYDIDNEFEVPGISKIEELLWKGKADIVGPEFIVDLKTTSKIDDFRWSAAKYNYDSQAYIYQKLFGKPLVFVAIDKTSAEIGLYHCSDEFLNRGRKKVIQAVHIYNKFFGPNKTNDIEQFYIREEL